MCTVSWLHYDGGYELFCNRDEKKTRGRATPPQIDRHDGVNFLAPIDPDFGGTWIAANEYGLAVCLLNGANVSGSTKAGQPGGTYTSRGHLVLELITAKSMRELLERFSGVDCSRYLPFTFAALQISRPAVVAEWDGTYLALVLDADALVPLVSSSFDAAGVRARRREHFRKQAGDGGALTIDDLRRFHESHAGAAGPYSPCMHRLDADTVSFSRVRVTASGISFYYKASAPCVSGPAQIKSIARRPLSF